MTTIQIDISKAVSVTGHRPNKIGGYNPSHPLRTAIRSSLKETVRAQIEQGYEIFISGMALGVDQDFAEVVLELKEEFPHIRLIAAVPFEGQEGNWPKESQEAFRKLLAKADEVVYVCDPGYAAWKMQRRNEWMVDRSSIQNAVWDGTEGGTGNCVGYARTKQDVAIIQINPKTIHSYNAVEAVKAAVQGGIAHV